MIEVKNLTKYYGSKIALSDVSFTVNEGEILGFLGPNGAGKSTAMNIITGYLSATKGTVTIDGYDILEEPTKAKKMLGFLPEQPPLYMDMTVKEYLNFVYDLKNCKIPRQSHLSDICKIIKITGVYNRMIRNLSKGYKQRVGIAQALIGNPEVLVLDEPTVGLDPNQIIEIRNLIKKLGKRHTVILSSHILPEVQAVCDRVVVISNGKIVADDTPDNLAKNLTDYSRYNVRIEGGDKNEIKKMLTAIPNMHAVTLLGERDKNTYEFTVEADESKGTDIRRSVASAAASQGYLILGLQSADMSLEGVFHKLTNGEQDSKIKDAKDIKKSEKLRKKLSKQLEETEKEKKEDENPDESGLSEAGDQTENGEDTADESAENGGEE